MGSAYSPWSGSTRELGSKAKVLSSPLAISFTRCHKIRSLCKYPLVIQGPGGFVILVEQGDSYLHGNLGEFTPTLEDVLCLTQFSLFGEANTMSLNSTRMIGEVEVLVLSNKSLKVIWEIELLHLVMVFDEWDGNRFGFLLQAFLAYWMPACFANIEKL